MKKILFFSILYCINLTAAHSQGTIKGTLFDSVAKAPLALATVTVFGAKDTSLVTYRLSNAEGEFKVPGLPIKKELRVVISFSGYSAFRHEFILQNDETLHLDSIFLHPVSKELDEILVIAERPPVTVRNDTIEFNASSFKTLPTSLVEDLLKKLPGVEVDRDGSIMANGRRVNRIMVDGKSFFGDDPKMATKNLPANVIDKVQITDDKDELASKTDDNLTNIGQVINLTLKKGVKKGWFGKLYGGGGTDDRYEIGGIANIYRDTLQLSVLAFSNNVNRSGFSMGDVQSMGGFDRSGYNSMMVMNRGGQTGFEINGISFGGLDAGVSKTTGAGFNLNHAPNQNKSFYLQYFYGNNKNNVIRTNNTLQFLNDTTINTLTNTISQRNTSRHNLGAGYRMKPDSLTDMNIRASFAYQGNLANSLSDILVHNNFDGNVSKGDGTQLNNVDNNEYRHNVYITRRGRSKKGRSLGFNHSLTYQKNIDRFTTESDYEYYVPMYNEQQFNQLRRVGAPKWNTNTGINFSEPLSSKITLRLSGGYTYTKEEREIGIYGRSSSGDKYDVFNPALSSGFDRNANVFGSRVALAFKVNKVTITPGIAAEWQHINTTIQRVTAPIRQNLFNILPGLSLNWKQLSVQYSQSVEVPSIEYLSPVPDSTNPFFIRYGNPGLKPARRNSLYINNFQFLQASSTSLNLYVNASMINNDVIMSRTVLPTGVQTTKAVNADGTINFSAGASVSKQFKKNPRFTYSLRLNPYFSFNKSKLIVNENLSTATTVRYSPQLTIGLNWNDIIEFNPLFRLGISRTSYSNDVFPAIKNVTHSAEGELIVRWPKKLVWETNLLYSYNNQAAPGMPRENVLWNAALTFLMLKNDAGMLKLTVFDLLNRNVSFSRYTSENTIVDERTNVLHRFGELTFTYNIQNMGAKKVGGRERLFLF
jgi:hypothetical protein